MTSETRTSPGVDHRRLPIGVFDSGVGGLTVLAALQRRLPNEDLLYLGDTARLPYGTKSPETVRRYARNAAQVLVERGVKMLVVACNTASAVALEDLVEAFAPLPTIGVVEPGAVAAVRATRYGRILVLGTEGTVRGGAYPRAIAAEHRRASTGEDRAADSVLGRLPLELTVWGQACPLFVTLAEEGWTEGEIPEAVARRYLAEHFATAGQAGWPRGAGPDARMDALVDFDTLVLGCTHFPMLTAALRNVVGPDVAIVDSAKTTADVVADALGSLDLLHPGPHLNPTTQTSAPSVRGPARDGERVMGRETEAAKGLASTEGGARTEARLVLMATDAPERFARVGSVFLGRRLSPDDVTLVDL